MKLATIPILSLLAISPLLAACGGDALPAEPARAAAAAPPPLVPAFDAEGLVARDPETAAPVFEIAAGVGHPATLVPLFAPDGSVRRCAHTGLPLWSLDGSVVRHACDCGR